MILSRLLMILLNSQRLIVKKIQVKICVVPELQLLHMIEQEGFILNAMPSFLEHGREGKDVVFTMTWLHHLGSTRTLVTLLHPLVRCFTMIAST